ncbi:hypothetical protein K443DRAFT_43475, partial [Laccaria amethystina LaAM-08-1]
KMHTRTRIEHAYQGVQGACPQQAVTKHQRHGQVLASADWNEKCAAELGLKMCTRTGIKDAYHSWD